MADDEYKTFKKADTRTPLMGLNNVICKEPAYWCRLHQVWLSEEDVEQKRCLKRLTYDMIAERPCNNIVKKQPPI